MRTEEACFFNECPVMELTLKIFCTILLCVIIYILNYS